MSCADFSQRGVANTFAGPATAGRIFAPIIELCLCKSLFWKVADDSLSWLLLEATLVGTLGSGARKSAESMVAVEFITPDCSMMLWRFLLSCSNNHSKQNLGQVKRKKQLCIVLTQEIPSH